MKKIIECLTIKDFWALVSKIFIIIIVCTLTIGALIGIIIKRELILRIIMAFICVVLLGITVLNIYLFLTFIIDMFFSKYLKGYNEKKMIKYDVPLFLYFFSVLTIMLIFTYIEGYLTNNYYFGSEVLYMACQLGLSYFLSITLYITIMNIGMYRRTKLLGKKAYQKKLEHHKSLLTLTFLPVTFLTATIGIVTAFKETSISFTDVSKIWSTVFNTSNIDVNNTFLYTIQLAGMLIVMSLPTLIIGYFVNQISIYLYYYGSAYKQFFIKGLKVINKLLLN